jgi:hypothetical protein
MMTSQRGTRAWTPTSSLKDKVQHEFIECAINVVYLALVVASFTQYRRFLLASYGIAYTNYWVAVIEAVIPGKVIMIGISSALAVAWSNGP